MHGQQNIKIWIVRIGNVFSRSLQILDFITTKSCREQLTKNDTRTCVSETALGGGGGRVGQLELDQLPCVVYSKIQRNFTSSDCCVFCNNFIPTLQSWGVLQTFALAFRWIKFNYVWFMFHIFLIEILSFLRYDFSWRPLNNGWRTTVWEIIH